jgi:serine/threonine protein phosphatase PrpC
VVANAGDSIALMAHNGSSHRLTEEHRLDNEAEAARVREAGGRVVRTRPGGAARLMGTSTQTRYKGSMVTRSLGDFAFKSPQALISAEPFVNTHTLDPTDRLVLLTSDGVTDVLPDDDMLDIGLRAIEQARSRTNNGNVLAQAAAKAVMDEALGKGSKDNITVVAMLLDWGNQFEDDPAQ